MAATSSQNQQAQQLRCQQSSLAQRCRNSRSLMERVLSPLPIKIYPRGIPRSTFGDLVTEPVFQSIIRNGGQIILASKLSDGLHMAQSCKTFSYGQSSTRNPHAKGVGLAHKACGQPDTVAARTVWFPHNEET
jgi:hypothetical protein